MNKNFSEQIQKTKEWLKGADAVLLGAGAGLSAAAGYDFTDRNAFAERYPGMLQYGFRCKLDLMGVWELPQELTWGYYLPHVKETRFGAAPEGVYTQLHALVSGLDFFVKTTNADGLFERSGFARDRIFTPQGDYARYQCLRPCTQEAFATEPLFARYLPLIDGRTQTLPKGKTPGCPRCGGPTFLNVRGGDWFVETPYLEEARRYESFLKKNAHKKLVVLDIGSGFNTPMWIRWPAERLVLNNPSARLVRINLHHPEVPPGIASRAVSLPTTADAAIRALWTAMAA